MCVNRNKKYDRTTLFSVDCSHVTCYIDTPKTKQLPYKGFCGLNYRHRLSRCSNISSVESVLT